jgi:hypothetical protein
MIILIKLPLNKYLNDPKNITDPKTNIQIADGTNDLNDTMQNVDQVEFSPQKKTRMGLQ